VNLDPYIFSKHGQAPYTQVSLPYSSQKEHDSSPKGETEPIDRSLESETELIDHSPPSEKITSLPITGDFNSDVEFVRFGIDPPIQLHHEEPDGKDCDLSCMYLVVLPSLFFPDKW
jgi:hypothetical protein